jgi:hypothetical protein
MKIDTIGAVRRPKLSLDFAGKAKTGASGCRRGAAILPSHELRRIVAAMID